MKKILPIILVFLAAVVALVLNLNYNKKMANLEIDLQKKAKTNREITKKETIDPNEVITVNGDYFTLLEEQRPLRCTFTDTNSNMKIDGTIYTNGINLRSNVRSDTGLAYNDTNAMILGDMVYMWTVTQTLGFSLNIKDFLSNNLQSASDTNIEQTVDQNILEKHLFTCTNWSNNQDMFVLPDNVQFMDFEEALNKLKESPCTICDNITDPSKKASCVQSLGCN